MSRTSSILPGIKAALFDFDGTLAVLNIDFAAMRHGVHDLMRARGVAPEDLEHKYVLEQIEEAIDLLGGDGEDFRREAHEIILAREISAAREGSLLPGAREFLRGLRAAGIGVGVLTRNCREAVRAIVPDIDEICDAFVPRDGLIRVKPHPDQLILCLKLLGTHASEAVMVGDHVIDVESGMALGMKTVGVLTGGGTQEALEKAGADLVLPDVTALAPFLIPERD